MSQKGIMDNSYTIFEELKRLSPAVANINRKNPFVVPFGYFDNFIERLFLKINQEEQQLISADNTIPFTVPNNFFENLAGKISDKVKSQSSFNDIVEELKSIAPQLIAIGRVHPYTIPDGYFETLLKKILAKIESNHAFGSITYLDKNLPYSLPDFYFETLAEKIRLRIRQSQTSDVQFELQEIAPILNTIQKGNVYSVPEGYFEHVNIDTNPVAKTKVVSMFGGAKRIVKLAAAAVVAGILVTSGYLFNNDNNVADTNSKAPYNANTIADFSPEQIKALTDQEIKEYLSSSSNGLDETQPIILEDDQDNLESLLKDMSEQEIRQFLQENAEPGEVHSKEG